MKKILFLFCLLLIFCDVSAQQNRYVVFFGDKDNTPYTLSEPEEFLSPRAIARRTNQGIGITEEDLPVDPSYIGGLKANGIDVYFASRWLNAALIQTAPEDIRAIEALEYVDSVVYVAPGARLSQGRVMKWKDEQITNQASDGQLEMLGVDALHQEGFTGAGMLIAFFDGGFTGANSLEAFEHIYQSGRLLYTLDLVENDSDVYHHSAHGTMTWSITGGYIPDIYHGVAYDASFMLFVTEDPPTEYRIEEYNWLFAAEKADSAGVDIINSSLGYSQFDDPDMNYSYSDMDGQTTIVSQAAKMAAERGILVVVSAGNEGDNRWQYITAPADVADVITVGAVTSSGQLSNFSSIGPSADGRIKPDVVALGTGTALITANGQIAYSSGTSFSAPLITGLAAALWQAFPEFSNVEIIQLVRSLGDRANHPDNQYGYGIPDYDRVSLLRKDEPFAAFPNPVVDETLTIRQNFPTREKIVKASIYSISGLKVRQFRLFYENITDLPVISLAGLQAGVYVLSLEAPDILQKLKIVKY